jgi:hypothetical protein
LQNLEAAEQTTLASYIRGARGDCIPASAPTPLSTAELQAEAPYERGNENASDTPESVVPKAFVAAIDVV